MDDLRIRVADAGFDVFAPKCITSFGMVSCYYQIVVRACIAAMTRHDGMARFSNQNMNLSPTLNCGVCHIEDLFKGLNL